MKLNHDCVRSIMLAIEENLNYGQSIPFNEVELDGYSHEEILYAADKLLEAGYLQGEKLGSIGSSEPTIQITSITWDGHKFLDNIRDDRVWKNTKKVISKFSSVSLSLTNSVAAQVILAFVKDQLKLP